MGLLLPWSGGLAAGDAAHRVERGGDRLEVVRGHPLGVLALGRRAALDARDDQGEAEAQPQVVVGALDLVGDRAEDGSGDAGEDDAVRLLEGDALAELLPAELDVAVEAGRSVPLDDVAAGHRGDERQGVVGLEQQAAPHGRAVEVRLAVLVDGQGVADVDHGSSCRGRCACTGGSAATMRLTRTPRCSISVRTTSPGRRDAPRPAPTPAGVPVAMTSPGSRVTAWLAAATRVGTSQIMSAVLPSCCSSSLTQRRMRRSCGSGTSQDGVRPGPSGSEPSRAFEANQSYWKAGAGAFARWW